MLINALSGPVGYLLNMTGFEKDNRNVTILSAFIIAGINFILIPKFGILGAAISTLISQSLWNGLLIFYAYKRLGFFPISIPWINKTD